MYNIVYIKRHNKLMIIRYSHGFAILRRASDWHQNEWWCYAMVPFFLFKTADIANGACANGECIICITLIYFAVSLRFELDLV